MLVGMEIKMGHEDDEEILLDIMGDIEEFQNSLIFKESCVWCVSVGGVCLCVRVCVRLGMSV